MLTLFIRRSATAIVLTTVVFVLGAGCSDTVGSGFSSDDNSDFDFRELPAVQQDYLRFKEAEDRRKDDVGDGLDMRADDPMKWGTGNLCQKGRIEVESRNEGATGKAKMFFSQRPARRKTVFGLGDGSQTLQNHYLDSESHYAQYSSQGEPESPTFNLIIRHPTVDLRFSGARNDLVERLPTGEVDSADTFMEKCGTAYESDQDRGIILVASIRLDLVSKNTRSQLRKLTDLNDDGSGDPTITGEVWEEWVFRAAQENGLGELTLKASPLRGAPSLEAYRNPKGRISFNRLEDYILDIDEAVAEAVENDKDESPYYGSILGRRVYHLNGFDVEDYEVELSDSARKAFGRVSEALRYRRPHFDGDSQFFREIPFAFHMVENPEWYEFGEGFSRDDWFNFVDAYRTCTDETIPAWHDRLIESFSRGDYQGVEDHEFMPTQCRPGHFNEKFDDIRRTPLLGVP